jgi:hypothetical protein
VEYEERFGILYERVEKRDSRASLLYGVFIYLRKLILSIIFIRMPKYPGIQASLAVINSFGLLVY